MNVKEKNTQGGEKGVLFYKENQQKPHNVPFEKRPKRREGAREGTSGEGHYREAGKGKGLGTGAFLLCSRTMRRPVRLQRSGGRKMGSNQHQGVCTSAFILSEIRNDMI